METDRQRLLRRLPKNAVCAEVGVWRGEFSSDILAATQAKVLHLVDPWVYDDSFPLSWFGGQEAKNQQQMDQIYLSILRKFQLEIASERVVVHRQTSQQVAQFFPDGMFDWIYLDANHTYQHAIQDLTAWFPKVKPGGYLAGDDYIEGGWFQGGVKKAVDEVIQQNNLEHQFIGMQFLLTA